MIFGEKGYLKPYEIINADLDLIKENFVTAFPNSKTRFRLFDNYLKFLYRFQDEVFPCFEQWMDGSFVTQTENPNDIDVVTFLDYRVAEKRGDKVLDKFWRFSPEDEGIDSYIVLDFPEKYPKNYQTKRMKEIWSERFLHTRRNRLNQVQKKDF